MLLFVEEYPPDRPTDPRQLRAWQQLMRERGTESEKCIREVLFPEDPDKVLTDATITAKKAKAQLENWTRTNSCALPEDMPVEDQDWFTNNRTAKKFSS